MSDIKTCSILVINCSEENYTYILDCLKYSQFLKFKVDKLCKKVIDQHFLKNQEISSHQLILIDRQKTQLNGIQPTVFTKPLIFLESESNTNLMPEWLAKGYHLRLYYHQINPIVLEHCLQLALYKEHQQSQIKALYEQVKVQLEKEVRLTRKIIGDINQYLLNPSDEKHIFSQVQSSPTPYNDSTTIVAPVGIMRSNLAGDYLYGNQMFFELFDLTEEEQLKGEWLSKIHSTDREQIKKLGCWLTSGAHSWC